MRNKKYLHFTATLVILSIISAGCISPDPRLKNVDNPLIPAEATKSIQNELSYVLAPSCLPHNVQFAEIRVGPNPDVCINYTDASDSKILFVCYPWGTQIQDYDYYPEYLPDRPDDFMSDMVINGMSAQLFRGMFTEETARRITRHEVNDEGIIEGEWDNTVCLKLLFEYKVNGEVIRVLIAAQPNTTDWITEDILISVAESLFDITPNLE